MTESFFKFLESLCVFCTNCDAWFSAKSSVERELRYGTNVGGLLMADPFYLVTRVYTCKHCQHLMRSTRIGIEDA